jgi:hypothetical protein
MRAHELLGDFWFAEPVPVAALRGRVLLIGFWDLSSRASLHALEYWEQWKQKYESHGMVGVAVHAPRFSFGREPAVVESSIRRLGLTLPVVMDNSGMIVSRYQVRTVPSLALIDRDGFVRLIVEGEGSVIQIERAIQRLLLEADALSALPDFTEPLRPADRVGVMRMRGTPELFGGYVKGSLGNVEGLIPESLTEYMDPGIHLEDRLYLEGEWMIGRESYEFGPVLTGKGSLIVLYSGLEASAVLRSAQAGGTEVRVTQDGEPVADPGEDLRRDQNGQTSLHVGEPRIYEIVRNREHGPHTLKLEFEGGKAEVFSLSFTAGVVPESISSN